MSKETDRHLLHRAMTIWSSYGDTLSRSLRAMDHGDLLDELDELLGQVEAQGVGFHRRRLPVKLNRALDDLRPGLERIDALLEQLRAIVAREYADNPFHIFAYVLATIEHPETQYELATLARTGRQEEVEVIEIQDAGMSWLVEEGHWEVIEQFTRCKILIAGSDGIVLHQARKLAALTQLRVLDLSGNPLRGWPDWMEQWPDLERLSLDRCSIHTAPPPSFLEQASGLRMLSLSGNRIPVEGRRAIAEALPNCHLQYDTW